jgi:4-amino-4-deoxy-L-arabinose transferase-like glycosyltransferase
LSVAQRQVRQRQLTRWHALILLGVAAALLLFWCTCVTPADIVGDAAENLQMALNLRDSGTISSSTSAPLRPSMQREPLPIFMDMLSVRVVDALSGKVPAADYYHGARARALKYQNLLWLALTTTGVFLTAGVLGLSFAPSVLAALCANALLVWDPWFRLCMLDSLLTESAAAAFLTLATWLLVLTCRGQRSWAPCLAGLCLGLAALVKALFVYIALGLVVALPLLWAWWAQPLRGSLRQTLLMGTVAVAVVLPWMLRNGLTVGYFDIAGRGGEALHDRAVLDQMTRDEYVGSFYAWAPNPFGGPLRRLLGYERTDLERGGRLQRLNEGESSFHESDIAAELSGRPDQTVTYYRRSRAEKMILINQYTADGSTQPLMAADRELKREAFGMLKQHPLRHLAVSAALLWRGGYFAFPLLALAFVYALRRRWQGLATASLPSLSLVLLYALMASFETRYAMPVYPLAVCLVVAAGCELWHRRGS